MPKKPTNENGQLPRRPDRNTPESLPISSQYLEFARRALPEELRLELHLEVGATYCVALARILFDDAMKGNVPAAREIRESIEGKAPKRRDLEGPRAIEIIVSYEPPILAMLPKDTPGPT
jgi:hypothetical protein